MRAALAILVVSTCLATATWAEESFQQNLRGSNSGEPMLTLTSADAAEHAEPTAEGYLFSLPASDAPLPPAGLLTQFRVRGDFEITAGFEIVGLTPPATGYGSGASLFVLCNSRDGATVARFAMPKAGEAIVTDRMSPAGLSGDKHDVQTAPTRSKSGKLRLAREGATLRYLFSEGGAEFQEVRRENFTKSDLTTVRLAADTGLSTGALAVRFTDFSVRADALPLGPASEGEARKWIAAWLAGTLAVVGTFAVAVVLRRRNPAPVR